MADKVLSLIATQVGRLRIQTFMIDFEADKMDEQGKILDEQFETTFAPSGFLDPLFELKILWDVMNTPSRDCICHRCKTQN
ncbi:hypothetical protein N7488_010516 [Penicillium malachiteum]|nr:hypothetical protein N7488_010516 [Penicillium malachiteum]